MDRCFFGGFFGDVNYKFYEFGFVLFLCRMNIHIDLLLGKIYYFELKA